MGPDEGSSRWAAEQAQRALEALRWNWGEAYKIDLIDGRWLAERLDGLGGPIEAGSPEELHTAIVADYELKPVPRDLPPVGGESVG